MPFRKTGQMSEADHKLVSDAVGAAEKSTSGEIVTIVTEMSDHYRDIAYLWSALVAFLALSVVAVTPDYYLGWLDRLGGGWGHEYSLSEYLTILLAFMLLKFGGMLLIMMWMPLRLFLAPKGLKAKRVRARAVSLFRVGAQGKTVGSTGILIYLSMREHRAEIVADEAIAGQVPPEAWGDAMAALIDHARAGKPGEGMAEAVRQVGVILAEHFPKGDDVTNELPDRLVEL